MGRLNDGGAATGGGSLGALASTGAGSSQVSHLAVALGFDRPHREQFHVSLGAEGAFIPAAAKLKPWTGGVGRLKDDAAVGALGALILAGAGSSQVVH